MAPSLLYDINRTMNIIHVSMTKVESCLAETQLL